MTQISGAARQKTFQREGEGRKTGRRPSRCCPAVPASVAQRTLREGRVRVAPPFLGPLVSPEAFIAAKGSPICI